MKFYSSQSTHSYHDKVRIIQYVLPRRKYDVHLGIHIFIFNVVFLLSPFHVTPLKWPVMLAMIEPYQNLVTFETK